MIKTNLSLAVVVATAAGSYAMADSNLDNQDAILAELQSLSDHCASLDDGQAQTEIFGIQIIRVGDTCAVVNGQEIDARVLTLLEEQNVPWAGVGLWVKADRNAD